MKKLKLLGKGIVLVILSNCDIDNSKKEKEQQDREDLLKILVTASAESVAPCEKNNTADVTFENRSNTNKTYDIIWDGSKIDTLAPSETSTAYTVAAGVQHTLQFKISNTSTLACTESTPTPAKCDAKVYWCTG